MKVLIDKDDYYPFYYVRPYHEGGSTMGLRNIPDDLYAEYTVLVEQLSRLREEMEYHYNIPLRQSLHKIN